MATYTGDFEGGTVDGWQDAGQSTVGVENSSPITGSFSLKVERTAAQGTGTVSAEKNTGLAVSVGTYLEASCRAKRTGSNLTTARFDFRVTDSGGSLLQTITGPVVSIVSGTQTLSVAGVITASSGFNLWLRVTSDANALDNGTDRVVIDTVFASDQEMPPWLKYSSGIRQMARGNMVRM